MTYSTSDRRFIPVGRQFQPTLHFAVPSQAGSPHFFLISTLWVFTYDMLLKFRLTHVHVHNQNRMELADLGDGVRRTMEAATPAF